jgi:hypothetical protein
MLESTSNCCGGVLHLHSPCKRYKSGADCYSIMAILWRVPPLPEIIQNTIIPGGIGCGANIM